MTANPFSRRLAVLLGVSLALSGCKSRDKKIRVQQTDEEDPSLASVVHMGDSRAGSQLLKGFYNIEEGAWRWTMGKFAVALRPPRGAAAKGATLHFKFVLPDAVLSKIKKITLSASVNGTALPPETYSKEGEYDYSRDVDAKQMQGEAVNVDFTMDNFLTAGMVETRELGLIATSVGFEAK